MNTNINIAINPQHISQQEREDILSRYLHKHNIGYISSTFNRQRIYTFKPSGWNNSVTVIIPPTTLHSSYELTKDPFTKVVQGHHLPHPFFKFEDLRMFLEMFRH